MDTTSPRARHLEYLPLDTVPRADRNPKAHDLDGIRGALAKFGCTVAGIIDERTGILVAGHGRLKALTAMRDDGTEPPEGVHTGPDGQWLVPIVRGWASQSDAEAAAYLVADNRLGEKGGWEERLLAEVLDEIADDDPALLEVTGYQVQDLDDMISDLDRDPGGDPAAPDEDDDADEGQLLELAGVTVGEPEHQVMRGQVWNLGPHVLVIADVYADWREWRDYLEGDALFWPYPTMLAPFAEGLADRRLIMVQPELYLAGHLLDKWQKVTGEAPQLQEHPQEAA